MDGNPHNDLRRKMVRQIELGATEKEQKDAIRKCIKIQAITLAGNQKLKIYGRLDCGSGKRMKSENRAFFKDEAEAKNHGYRPCGNCMPALYQKWKKV